jgi:hypothetical protein
VTDLVLTDAAWRFHVAPSPPGVLQPGLLRSTVKRFGPHRWPGPRDPRVDTENSWLLADDATLFVFLGGADECGAPVSQSFRCAAQ